MADPAELQRITRLLEVLIRVKNRTVRDLERHLGFSAGTLARILNGKIELKFRLVLDVLELLDVPPKTFFRMAYEIEDPQGEGYEALIGHLRRLSVPEVPPPQPELRAQVEALVLQALSKLGLTAEPPPTPIPPKESGPPRPSRRRKRPDKGK